jgi:redox-sensitive bicupin YhaK (pirin superfamily)
MITTRKANDRGHAEHGWLDSHHTFSFADYYDPAQMNYRSLRVINEDRVAASGGFPTHPHRDMEIFSYMLSGSLAHRDSLGNGRSLTAGQVQLMSAGTGVAHSEFNPSSTEPAHFLQIWIQPRAKGLAPRYTEWHPTPELDAAPKVLIISHDGRDNSATIAQDADIYRLRLAPGEKTTHDLPAGHGAWLQVMRGSVTLNGHPLATGDGASVENEARLEITGTEKAEALLFDLA